MNRIFLLLLLLGVPFWVMADELVSDDDNKLPLGVLSREQVLSRKIYDFNYVEYVPKSDPIQALHNYSGFAEIKVFFGDWCKDSKKHVPALIKSLEFADNPNIQVTFINLSRDKKNPAELIEGWNIVSVPTFIVLVDGKEIGRIVEFPKISVEQDLMDILTGRSQRAETP